MAKAKESRPLEFVYTVPIFPNVSSTFKVKGWELQKAITQASSPYPAKIRLDQIEGKRRSRKSF